MVEDEVTLLPLYVARGASLLDPLTNATVLGVAAWGLDKMWLAVILCWSGWWRSKKAGEVCPINAAESRMWDIKQCLPSDKRYLTFSSQTLIRRSKLYGNAEQKIMLKMKMN